MTYISEMSMKPSDHLSQLSTSMKVEHTSNVVSENSGAFTWENIDFSGLSNACRNCKLFGSRFEHKYTLKDELLLT